MRDDKNRASLRGILSSRFEGADPVLCKESCGCRADLEWLAHACAGPRERDRDFIWGGLESYKTDENGHRRGRLPPR